MIRLFRIENKYRYCKHNVSFDTLIQSKIELKYRIVLDIDIVIELNLIKLIPKNKGKVLMEVWMESKTKLNIKGNATT